MGINSSDIQKAIRESRGWPDGVTQIVKAIEDARKKALREILKLAPDADDRAIVCAVMDLWASGRKVILYTLPSIHRPGAEYVAIVAMDDPGTPVVGWNPEP